MGKLSLNTNIPFYGQTAMLRDALQSLLNQQVDGRVHDITVYDNHSPEPAADLKSEFGDRVTFIKNEENVGIMRNWNKAIGNGDHDIVHMLHHDDTLEQGFYNEVMKVFENNPQVGLVYTDFRFVFSSMTSVRYWKKLFQSNHKPAGGNFHTAIIPKGDQAVRYIMDNPRVVASVVLRRDAVKDVGLFRLDLPYSSDEEYWARVAAKWDIAHIQSPLMICRMHKNNTAISTWVKDDFFDRMIETRYSRIRHLSNPPKEEFEKENERLANLAVDIAYKLISLNKREFVKGYLQKAKDIFPPVVNQANYKETESTFEKGFLGYLKAKLTSSH